MKKCICCGEAKPLDEYYTHPQMKDGHLGRCKECQKELSRSRDKVKRADYDKTRETTPERKAAKKKYQQNRRALHPDKYKAHSMVSDHIRNGRLMRKPCIICGNEKSQAHHPDYCKPIDVVWLCFKHHRSIHGQKVAELIIKQENAL